MKLVCQADFCTGCMACVNVCPTQAVDVLDTVAAYNAQIDPEKCVGCARCEKVCPVSANPRLMPPIYWKQGWAKDEIRRQSSSGGVASAITRAFISSGGYVASCHFEHGEFGFSVTNDVEKAKHFAGSKYVKSNPGTIYMEIQRLLKQGNKVLFIGLPCQSAAVQNVCGMRDELYTVDLICHGTPSPRLLKQFITEIDFEWERISDIQFRDNESFGLSVDGERITPRRVEDSYLRAFLNSIDYTENCYSCQYAARSRVSDITLGDAWGQLSDTVPGGVSLLLCQTQKGIDLLNSTELHLEEVNLDKAVESNQQLQHPSIKHSGRDVFLNEIRRGRAFRTAVAKAIPYDSIKQSIKMGLINLGGIKDRG